MLSTALGPLLATQTVKHTRKPAAKTDVFSLVNRSVRPTPTQKHLDASNFIDLPCKRFTEPPPLLARSLARLQKQWVSILEAATPNNHTVFAPPPDHRIAPPLSFTELLQQDSSSLPSVLSANPGGSSASVSTSGGGGTGCHLTSKSRGGRNGRSGSTGTGISSERRIGGAGGGREGVGGRRGGGGGGGGGGSMGSVTRCVCEGHKSATLLFRTWFLPFASCFGETRTCYTIAA